MPSDVRSLARQLLESGGAERLETPLDQLATTEADEELAEQLLAAHVEGVAHTLRELLEEERLVRWVEETCTQREEAALARGLARWLGQLGAGADDPEASVHVPEPPHEPTELARWAQVHDVEECLDLPFEPAAGASLREACLGQAPAGGGSLLDADAPMRAARESLWREAAARAAVAQRLRRWREPLPDGPLRGLMERLRALLVDQSPRQLAQVRFVPAHPAHIDVSTGVARARQREAGVEGIAVRLLLSGHEHGGLVGECSRCDGPHCAHTRALAARLLDAAFASEDGLHGALCTLAGEPSWKRFVRALATPDEHASGTHEPLRERVSFRVCWDDRQPRLGAFVHRPLEDGGWSSGRLASPRKLLGRAVADDDRHVLETMARQQLNLGPAYVALETGVLRALVEHPRVYFQGPGTEPSGPLRVHEARLTLDLQPGAQGLVPRLSLAGHALSASEARGATGHVTHVDADANELVFGALTPALRRLLAALDHFRGVLPPESYPELAPMLASLRRVAEIHAPEALLGQQLPTPHRLLLRIVPSFAEGIDVTLSTRPLPLGALWPPGTGPELVHGLVEGKAVRTRRDLIWERETGRVLLEALGLRDYLRVDDFRYRIDSTQGALAVLSAAARHADVLDLEWAERGRRLQLGPTLRAADLKVRLFKRGEWLKLDGSARTASGDVPVQRLLEAVRQGERFVRVAGDDYAEIEQALFERLERAQLCVIDPKSIQPALSRASLAFALAQWPPGLEVDPEAADWVRAAERRAPREPAERWRPVLRDYQWEGVRWLLSLSEWAPGACLADEMGLGKTLQAIVVLTERAARGPALVLAPTSVASNWIDELRRFAPDLRAHLLEGPNAVEALGSPGPGDVWVASYERLLRDREALQGLSFATQVVDEAQLLKNARTRRTQAVRAISAEFKLALTGTPIENRLGDLWSLFQWVAPGLLGSWARFRAIFAVPIERHENPDRARDLRALIAPLMLRRLKRDVATQLPTRTESVQLVALSPAERALYDSTLRRVRRHLSQPRRERTETMSVLAELTQLRQLACHPRLVLDEPSAESSKLAALMQLLDDVLPRGHRVLIFSQFVRHLQLAREALEAREVEALYLDGSTPARSRAALVRRFQEGEGKVFLISLKAGGTGLNLTAADYVVHLDPWWNPAAEDQASDRAHRIGQQRPVTIVKLVAEGTIEERVLSLHAHKRELSDAMLQGQGEVTPFDLDAMRELLEVAAG